MRRPLTRATNAATDIPKSAGSTFMSFARWNTIIGKLTIAAATTNGQTDERDMCASAIDLTPRIHAITRRRPPSSERKNACVGLPKRNPSEVKCCQAINPIHPLSPERAMRRG